MGSIAEQLNYFKKKVIRIITVSKYNAHTEPLMKTLSILKIEDMFKLDILKWYYKYCHKQLAVYFQKFNILRHPDIHDYATRNNSFIPIHLHASSRCLRNHVPVVLNNTSDDIINKINIHSYEGFAAYVKKYITSSYSTECSIENCCLWYVIIKYAFGKLLCVYAFEESFHSSIKHGGYLITSTYCIEVLQVCEVCSCVLVV